VIESEPGDEIAFDVRLLYASPGDANRPAWTVEYLPSPGLAEPARIRAVRELVMDAVEFDQEPCDHDRWPTWSEWAVGARRVVTPVARRTTPAVRRPLRRGPSVTADPPSCSPPHAYCDDAETPVDVASPIGGLSPSSVRCKLAASPIQTPWRRE
jgi:hypothetical protein